MPRPKTKRRGFEAKIEGLALSLLPNHGAATAENVKKKADLLGVGFSIRLSEFAL